MYDLNVSPNKLSGKNLCYSFQHSSNKHTIIVTESATQMQIYCMEELHRACAKGTIRK